MNTIIVTDQMETMDCVQNVLNKTRGVKMSSIITEEQRQLSALTTYLNVQIQTEYPDTKLIAAYSKVIQDIVMNGCE